MKILILGTPRSGSTSLVKFIDSHIKLSNYQMVIEPFNQNLYPNKKYDEDRDTILYVTKYNNVLVKSLFLLGYEEYPIKSFNNIYEYLNWCYSYFDKIIVIDRKDKIAQSESFAINETMFREKNIGWHVPKIYDVEKIEPSYIKTMIDRYTESGEILKEISDTNNFPIFYYEDIFLEHNLDTINTLLEYLGLELNIEKYNEFILSSYKRVRIEKPSHKKLL
jgi:hypothetical protein